MWRNSIAGGCVPAPSGILLRLPASAPAAALLRASGGTAVGFHVVRYFDPAGNNVRLSLLHLGLDFRGDQLLVVLIERPVDASLLQAENAEAGLPSAVVLRHQAVVGGEIDPFDH